MREFRIAELVFIIIMITFTISKGLGFAPLPKESQKSYSPPYAMISPLHTVNFPLYQDTPAQAQVQPVTQSLRQDTPPSSRPSSATPAPGSPISTATKGVSTGSSQLSSPKAQALQPLGGARQGRQVAAPQNPVQAALNAAAQDAPEAAVQNAQHPLLDRTTARAKAKKVADYLNKSSQTAHKLPLPLNAQINITDNDGVWTTNLLHSEATFYELGKLVDRYPRAVKLADFVPATKVPIHKEHITNSSILSGLTVPREEGAAYAMLATHHVEHTKDYAVLWSGNISYVTGGGKGDLLDQLDIYELNYTNAQAKMYTPGSKNYEDLDYYGTDLSGAKKAITFGFARDRNMIANMGVERRVLLPWSHCNHIVKGQTQNIREFIQWADAGQGRSYNAAEAQKILTTALTQGKNVTDHIRAVRPILAEGSKEAKTSDRILTDFYVVAVQAIDVVESSGHSIDSQIQDNFFKPKGAPLDLEQAEELAITVFNRTNALEGVPSIFPSNYKQKGDKLRAPTARD